MALVRFTELSTDTRHPMLTLDEMNIICPAHPGLHPLDRLYYLAELIRTADAISGLTEYYRTTVIPLMKKNLKNPCTELALCPPPPQWTTTAEMLKLGQFNKNNQILPSYDYVGFDDWNPNNPSLATVAAETKFLAEYMGDFSLPEFLLEAKPKASQASMGFQEKDWDSSFYLENV